jgi:hypothetical protein
MLGLGILATPDDPSQFKSLLVVVANPQTAARVREELPRVRIVVLHRHATDSAAIIHARAWEHRNADWYFYDPAAESLDWALVRERMKSQGVVPINLRQHVRTPPRPARPHATPHEMLSRRASGQ